MGSNPPVICVFCGSSAGKSPIHLESARELARAMHKAGAKLVYGAGTVGLMGEVAKTLVQLSGKDAVHGIIPSALIVYEQQGVRSFKADPKDLISEDLYGRTTVVPDMHARKRMMAEEVDKGGPGSGFITLAGGYGSVEELFEMTTWNQLGIHNRPLVLLNTDGYYDGILAWIRRAVEDGFVHAGNGNIIVEAKHADECVDLLKNYKLGTARFNLDWKSEGKK